jgi:hypothetical protein
LQLCLAALHLGQEGLDKYLSGIKNIKPTIRQPHSSKEVLPKLDQVDIPGFLGQFELLIEGLEGCESGMDDVFLDHLHE